MQIASVSLLDGRRCVPLSRCEGRFADSACLPESPARTGRVVGARTSWPGRRESRTRSWLRDRTRRSCAHLSTGSSSGAELPATCLPARWQSLLRRAGKGAAGRPSSSSRLSAVLQESSNRPDADGVVWLGLSRTWRAVGVMPRPASAATRSQVVTPVRDVTDLSRVPATDRYPSLRGVQLAAATGNVRPIWNVLGDRSERQQGVVEQTSGSH